MYLKMHCVKSSVASNGEVVEHKQQHVASEIHHFSNHVRELQWLSVFPLSITTLSVRAYFSSWNFHFFEGSGISPLLFLVLMEKHDPPFSVTEVNKLRTATSSRLLTANYSYSFCHI